VSATTRYETIVREPVGARCQVCGATLPRAGTGRPRRYCGSACRQRAYRLRGQTRHSYRAAGQEGDPAEVTRLLNAILPFSPRR
jgi:hypothetical protein